MSTVNTNPAAIDWFLEHAVERVLPDAKTLRERLLKGERIRVYFGIDPTGPAIHLGHTVPVRKMAELQALGHEVILLIGDFTAMIGDPTDKSAARKRLTREEVLANLKGYKDQLSTFLKFDGENAVQIRFNSEWLGAMSFGDVVELAAHFTVQQMAERDMFAKRLNFTFICENCKKVQVLSSARMLPAGGFKSEKGGKDLIQAFVCRDCGHDNCDPTPNVEIISPTPIYLHEFMYPLMQGQDSVALDVDLEVGGNDQTFNMLAGRTLLREVKGKEKFVMTCKLLADPTGKKMGKSEGNMISLMDTPEDAYGKIMSWPDVMVLPGFDVLVGLTGDLTQEKAEIDQRRARIQAGENPMTLKKELAHRIVATCFGTEGADRAAAHFASVHQDGALPEEIVEVKVEGVSIALVDALILANLVDSKTEARRQIEQNAVRVSGTVVTDVKMVVEIPSEGIVLQKGKRGFAKLVRA